MSSVLLTVLTVGAGLFTVALGFVHLAIPRLVGYRSALGSDARFGAAGGPPPFATIGVRGLTYRLRRSDLLGITWVMSNAASYVLITIGLVDLAWSVGWRGLPVALGATWISVWWAIRSGGQFALGRRRGDVLAAAWFGALAVGHVVLAIGPG